MANPDTDTTMPRPASGIISPRPMRSRTQSISSDRPSTIAHSLMSPPLSVSPEAVFIAASAASQIVTNDHDSHADTWYDQHGIEPAGETALVSLEALQLVNSFLDQLLFNFLQGSRATTLAALRPAVTEVLKPKLAKDAVNNADEELREYLGGGDEDDYVHPQGGNPSRDWDLELVWKRTRLRCMVYSSLGDMEEEDEDLYMEQENLELGADESVSDVISPAVAIFLTSVLEYMGELTLTVAGQAAYHRLRAKHEKEIKEGSRIATDIADRIVVEEADMERVALDRTLGRLWRGWKKRIRSPVIDIGRPFSRASMGHLRRDSSLTTDGFPLSRTATHSDIDSEAKMADDHEGKAPAEKPKPSEIALPLGDNDVDEIEVPGLAVYSDDEAETEDEEEATKETKGRRPTSLLILPIGVANDLPTPTMSQPHTPVLGNRKRSNSLPTPGSSPYRSFPRRPKELASIAKTVAIEDDAKKESSTVEPEEVDPAEDPTPKATKQNKRLSKIMTTTPPGFAMTGITATAQANVEGTDDVARYEKAEIMTSARVSVAGSSSPAHSDSGGPFSLKRSSSVHSARIIDVTGPKSPTGSRSPSLENTERIRPVSVTLSRTSSLSNRSNTEDPRMPKVLENVVNATTTVPKNRSPVDRMRGSISNAATISESEEEVDIDYSKDQKKAHRNATFQPSPLPASVPEDTRSPRGSQSYAGSHTQHHSPTHRQSPSDTKATNLRTSNSNDLYDEDQLPDIPRKAAGHVGRHGSRGERAPTSPTHSIGMVSVERTKTRDSDEDTAVASTAGFAPRPIHTSGSSASSGTSRLKPVRTSEENASSRSNVARNFEELIQSNQTITYTLTPENMRDIDSKRSLDSPMIPKGSRRSDDARGHNRSRSSSAATDLKGSPNSRFTGLSSHSIDKGAGARSSPKRGPLAQARDARVPSESIADFAEFIKSTGPTGDNRPTPLRNMSGGPPTPSKTSLDSRRISSNSARLRYQPREAAIDRAGNSDLIDFIRQGPPSTANNRIPKTVAPFMDDEMSGGAGGVAGGRAVDATIPDIRYSQASTHGTDTSMPSMQSSINSHTALLKNKGGSMPSSKMFDDDDIMPKRKTRRVRDPYAIDFSDEDDDDDFITTATPKPPVKKEESLAEFLRNYEPPPEPVSAPISHKIPKKKASAPSLIGRFTRSSTNHSSNGSVSQSSAGNDSRSLSSRGGIRGYIPIQVSMPTGYDKYGAIDSKPSRPPMPASAGSAGRVPMKRFEPREAASNVTKTSDLASFLRNSEPPPEPVQQPPPQQESGSSLSKMFSRRKKNVA
ncbi:Fc.00g101610.m01.CDS01 [Cosmosporella sp. VM-42]